MPAGRPKLYHTEEERIAAIKAYGKRYREAHKELVAERKSKWHRENAELCLARGRARYHSLSETQKELLAERQRKWYQKNAESCRARNMARYHRLRELRNRPPELPELPAPEPPELPAPEQARQPAREATAVIIVIFPR